MHETLQNQSRSNDLLTTLFGLADVGSERLDVFFRKLEFKRFPVSPCWILAKFLLAVKSPEGFCGKQWLHEAKAGRPWEL